LFAGALAYFIWRFNPEFKMPENTKKDKEVAAQLDFGTEDQERSEGALLFIEESVAKNKKNKLKDGQDLPLIIAAAEHDTDPQAPFLREEILSPVVPITPINRLQKKTPP